MEDVRRRGEVERELALAADFDDIALFEAAAWLGEMAHKALSKDPPRNDPGPLLAAGRLLTQGRATCPHRAQTNG